MKQEHNKLLANTSDDEFINIVKNSKSITEIYHKLGYSGRLASMYTLIKNRINQLNIKTNFEHSTNSRTIPLDEILVENSKYSNMYRLKKRLLKEHLLEYKCIYCGNQGEWLGRPLALHMHHINGVYTDNRLENLAFVCPNCHSQTDSYSGKNK